MIKQKWSIFILAVLLFSSPFLVLAQQTEQEANPNQCLPQLTQAERCRRILGAEALWWREGRKLYQSNCRSCHQRNNDVGASFLHVESKTQRGWDQVFVKRYSKCAKNGSWDSLTERQLQDINDFLYRYAYGAGGIYEARMS